MMAQTLRKYTTSAILTALSTAFIFLLLMVVNYIAYESSESGSRIFERVSKLVSDIQSIQSISDRLIAHEGTYIEKADMRHALAKQLENMQKYAKELYLGEKNSSTYFTSHVSGFMGTKVAGKRSPYEEIIHVGEEVENILSIYDVYKNMPTGAQKDKAHADLVHLLYDIDEDFFEDTQPLLIKLHTVAEQDIYLSKRKWSAIYYAVAGLGFLVLFLQILLFASPVRRQLETETEEREKEYRQLAETRAAQEEMEERYELALSGTRFGIWDWDLRTNRLYWTTQLKNMLGIGEDQFKGTLYDFESRIDPNDLDRTMEAARRHIEEGVQFDCEYRFRHEEGYMIWIGAKGQAIWDASGKPVRMAGSMEDITEKKETQLRTELFIAGLEASPLCISILDMRDGGKRFSYVSPAFCVMSGYTQAKLLNANINILIGPDTNMSDLDSIDAAIKNAWPIKLEILNYKQDGTSFKNMMQMTPIFDDNNKLRAYVMIHHDMTADIAREKQEMNRQRMESLGTLASNVAHEINNLLVPMMMAKDIIEPDLKENADPYTTEHLNQIVSYAEQAREIVKGILTFARKEAETRMVLDFNAIMREAVDFVSGLVRNGTKIVYDTKIIERSEILINRTEFRQIITNFISNADYALRNRPDPFVKVTAERKTLSRKERETLDIALAECIEITIEDNGAGIPQNVINRIFEPLFTTKPIGEGTGLGLSVVHGIIKNWGGGISVTSVENVGTVFKLYIPLYFDSDDIAMYSDLLDELNDEAA